MFLRVCRRPRRSRSTGTKKQADFSCMDARKAVYSYAGDPRKK